MRETGGGEGGGSSYNLEKCDGLLSDAERVRGEVVEHLATPVEKQRAAGRVALARMKVRRAKELKNRGEDGHNDVFPRVIAVL